MIFGLATNLLILFDIQFLYLRAIFSLIFLAIIPGMLIMLILKIRKLGFWEYMVYAIGLSMAFVMFAGLFANWSNFILHPANLGKELAGNIIPISDNFSIQETELPRAVKNIWIGGNNDLYGYYRDEIVKSADNGITWTSVYKFTEGEGNRKVWVDSRGTVFAGRDETGLLYMSKDGDSNWTTPLKFSCQNKPMANGQPEGYGTLWNMDEDSLGNLYVGEYSGEWDANCAYIHKSTDGGLTWSISYNSLAYDWPGRHIHMVKVDPKNDFIYATQGDGFERARLIRSTDRGKTWTTLQSRMLDAQYTTMIFFQDNRLFGTDAGSLTNKILNTSDDRNFSLSAEFNEEISDFIWSSSKNLKNDVAFIGTVSEKAGGDSGLYGTRNKGNSWHKVKDLGVTTREYQGIDSISNFGTDGYAYYHDNLNDKTHRLKYVDNSAKQSLPFSGQITKPLSLPRILITFDAMLLIFACLAFKRNADLGLKIELPRVGLLNLSFFVAPVILLTLSVLGAVVLNNNGSNTISMLMLGGTAIYVFFAFFLRDKLNENIFPWAILTTSISFLLTGWLRSWFVSGADINLEYHIFQLVKENQYWSMSLFNSAYTACLSVTILPAVLSFFMNINDQYIFKLIIPLIFSITPVCVYLFFRRYATSALAFLAAFFFMSQPVFMSWWWIPIRQEIAFLFFALVLLVLFSKTISSLQKNILLLVFLFSMAVSHYSTTYIALSLLILTYVICLIYRKTRSRQIISRIYKKIILNGEDELENTKYYISGLFLLAAIMFTFIWYAQLTKISGNLVEFAQKTTQNMGQIFNDDIRADGASLGMQLNIFFKQKDDSLLLQNYIEKASNIYKTKSYIKTYPQKVIDKYKIEVIPGFLMQLKTNKIIAAVIYFFQGLVQKMVKIFIILYIFCLIVIRLKKINIDIEYKVMIFVSLFSLMAMMVLPFASIDYDLMRQYQQLLVILSLPLVLGGFIVFIFLKNDKFRNSIAIMVFLLYFLFISGFIPQIIGKDFPGLQLNNSGGSYDELYVHETEVKSSEWLFKNRANDELIYADSRAYYKLWFSSNVREGKITRENKIIREVFPSTIDKNAYVYSSRTNTLKGVAYASISGDLINYNFPAEFLNQNKNLIYSNGESKVFK